MIVQCGADGYRYRLICLCVCRVLLSEVVVSLRLLWLSLVFDDKRRFLSMFVWYFLSEVLHDPLIKIIGVNAFEYDCFAFVLFHFKTCQVYILLLLRIQKWMMVRMVVKILFVQDGMLKCVRKNDKGLLLISAIAIHFHDNKVALLDKFKI